MARSAAALAIVLGACLPRGFGEPSCSADGARAGLCAESAAAPQFQLAACTVFRDEDRFLREWLAFEAATDGRLAPRVFRLAGIYGPGRSALDTVARAAAERGPVDFGQHPTHKVGVELARDDVDALGLDAQREPARSGAERGRRGGRDIRLWDHARAPRLVRTRSRRP